MRKPAEAGFFCDDFFPQFSGISLISPCGYFFLLNSNRGFLMISFRE